MSKKVIFNTINNEFLTALSDYNVNLHKLDTARKAHNEKSGKLLEIKKDIVAKREKAVEDRPETTVQELDKMYNLPEALRNIQAENLRYAEECKGYNEVLKNFIKIYIEDMDFYQNYITYIQSHSDKKLKESYRAFFQTIGAEGADNETALNKIVDVLVQMIGSRMVNSTNSKGVWSYVKAESKSLYHKHFVSVLLQLLVNEKGVLTVLEDNSLIMTVYETETETK